MRTINKKTLARGVYMSRKNRTTRENMTTLSVSLTAMSMAAINKMMVKTSGNRSAAVDTIIRAWKRDQDSQADAMRLEWLELKGLIE